MSRREWHVFYSQYSHLAVKPFISRKSQFLPAPLAFDAPGKGGGFRRNIVIAFGVEELKWYYYPTVEKN